MIELDPYDRCIAMYDFILEAEDDFDCVVHIYNDEMTIAEMLEVIKCTEPIEGIKKYRKRYAGDRLIFCIVGDYVRTGKPIYISYEPEYYS